jgi:two-component system, NtrC family, response regulator AtoC
MSDILLASVERIISDLPHATAGFPIIPLFWIPIPVPRLLRRGLKAWILARFHLIWLTLGNLQRIYLSTHWGEKSPTRLKLFFIALPFLLQANASASRVQPALNRLAPREPRTMKRGKLLLVDEDRRLLEKVTDWLRGQGYYVDAVLGCADALEQIQSTTYDLLIAEVHLQDGSGFDLLEQVSRTKDGLQVILMTGCGDADLALEALHAGACDFLTKPLISDELLMSIERTLALRQVVDENVKLRRALDKQFAIGNIIGQDSRMLKIFEMIQSVADTKATILISGESGTGKSMIARAIHRHSSRSGKPFIEVACGALPENLLESELFGHVKGSFTGATGDKDGKFMQADGGTIFLDEIGTSSPAMQVKLLRVLQELEFEQVGGDKTFHVDVRVILATNEDLSIAVEEGRFRQDLYYRINVINLELPPLRRRPSDIPLLAQTFLEKTREDTNRTITGFSDDTLAALESYHWPGNIRELQNVVERAVLLGKEDTITSADLPRDVVGAPSIAVHRKGSMTLKEALEEPERQIIQEVLESHNWNRNATADALGVNRTTLYKKMKRLGLEGREI